MPFDATNCTVESKGDKYEVRLTVRYVDANGKILNMRPLFAFVTKADVATMRAELVATLRPLLDAAVSTLQDEESGKTSLSDNILTQVNAYLSNK